jgi:hypothetical protein
MDATTQMTLNGGVGSNWSEKADDITTQYCYGNGRALKLTITTLRVNKTIWVRSKKEAEAVRKFGYRASDTVNLGGAWYMKDIGIGRARADHTYMFARRMDDRGKEYFLEKTPSKTYAQFLRNHYIMKYYPRELGDLRSQILAWVDIAKAAGNHGQFIDALGTAIRLGVGWNTLKSRYGDAAVNEAGLSRYTEFFKHFGENREIND